MEFTKDLLSISVAKLVLSPDNVRRHAAGGDVARMKKDVLLVKAASRLAGKRWVPIALRPRKAA